mmetsp:Transcript_11655/g.16868  ORF Transcript_11655/g.16868 Transcript_11655/m.16868 type:complete len:272 (-) Transcript_11655:41-856(-)
MTFPAIAAICFGVASSRTTVADLPPSSVRTRFKVFAPAAWRRRPTRVDPVNDTMSTLGCSASNCAVSGPVPITMLKTPFGSPAAWIASATRMALMGVTSLGLSTTVQPAKSAGAILHAIWLRGQFHGVMQPTTPMGSFTISVLPMSSVHSKASSSARPRVVIQCMLNMNDCTRAAKSLGAPSSFCRFLATSPWRSEYSSRIRSRYSRRSSTLVRDHVLNASAAASTALAVSSDEPFGARANTSPVFESNTSIKESGPLVDSTHSPLMYCLV